MPFATASLPTPLSALLHSCVQRGIIDEDTARRIQSVGRDEALLGAPAEAGWTPLLLTTELDPELTFETLVPSRQNAFPLEMAQLVASTSPARTPYNPLYVYADVGVGKTHLLSAIAHGAAARGALLVNTADLDAELDRARRTGQRAELRRFLGAPEVLLLDDIQLCEGREELQRELFAVLSQRMHAGRSAVITCDVPPTRLAGVEARLVSRLGAGVIVGLQMGEKEWRKEVLRRACLGRELPEDVLDFVADRVSDSVRSLKAAAVQLLAWRDRTGALDLAAARAVLDRAPPPSRPAPPPASPPASPQEVSATPKARPEPPASAASAESRAARFKQMLQGAETEEEQVLALQIALSERLRQLKAEGGDAGLLARLERALALLREGKAEDAMREVDGGGRRAP